MIFFLKKNLVRKEKKKKKHTKQNVVIKGEKKGKTTCHLSNKKKTNKKLSITFFLVSVTLKLKNLLSLYSLNF